MTTSSANAGGGGINLSNFYKPYPHQVPVHESRAKEKYLEWARRRGKSRCAFGELLQCYFDWWRLAEKGKRDKYLEPPFHAWIVVPTENQGTQTWNELQRFIPRDLVLKIDQDKHTVTLIGPNDLYAFIEMRSAYNADALQTVGIDFLWVNESQDVSDAAMQKLRPILHSQGRMQRAVFEGIPSLYADHWFRRGCMAAQRRQNKDWAYFHGTVYENETLTQADLDAIEADREIIPESAWRRMYLAEFSASAGFFRNIEACINGDLLSEPVPGATYVAGIDLGISNDYTVMIIMDAQHRRVVHHALYDSMAWPDQKANIEYLADKWALSRIQVDATSMQRALAEELAEMGLAVEYDNMGRPGMQIVGETRQNLLSDLQVATERETISFPSIGPLVRQMRAFQYIRVNTASGTRLRAQAPAGEHDDEVFALAMALQVCEPPDPPSNRFTRVKNRAYMSPSNETSTQPRASAWHERRRQKSDALRHAAEQAGIRV